MRAAATAHFSLKKLANRFVKFNLSFNKEKVDWRRAVKHINFMTLGIYGYGTVWVANIKVKNNIIIIMM